MATKKTWQQRTAEHRKAAVLDILRRPVGESENAAIPRIAAKYNGRNLPNGKHLKLSGSTLRRLWYAWKKEPSDRVFDLHFSGAAAQSIIQPWVGHLFADYAVSRGLSIPRAYRELKAATPDLPFSLRTVSRHLSARARKRIGKATVLRKKQNDLNKQWKTLTQGGS